MDQSCKTVCVNEKPDMLFILIKPILIIPLCVTENGFRLFGDSRIDLQHSYTRLGSIGLVISFCTRREW